MGDAHTQAVHALSHFFCEWWLCEWHFECTTFCLLFANNTLKCSKVFYAKAIELCVIKEPIYIHIHLFWPHFKIISLKKEEKNPVNRTVLWEVRWKYQAEDNFPL